MVIDVTNIINEGSVNLTKNPIKVDDVQYIMVHTTEGDSIPHFHIIRSKYGVHDCCVMLNDNKFFNHGKNDSLLNSKEQRELDKWLRKQNKGKPEHTNFQELAEMWNKIPNARFRVDLYRDFDYTNMGLYKE